MVCKGSLRAKQQKAKQLRANVVNADWGQACDLQFAIKEMPSIPDATRAGIDGISLISNYKSQARPQSQTPIFESCYARMVCNGGLRAKQGGQRVKCLKRGLTWSTTIGVRHAICNLRLKKC